jgi:hypothetical protein
LGGVSTCTLSMAMREEFPGCALMEGAGVQGRIDARLFFLVGALFLYFWKVPYIY